MRYLLDTNVCIEIGKRNRGPVNNRVCLGLFRSRLGCEELKPQYESQVLRYQADHWATRVEVRLEGETV